VLLQRQARPRAEWCWARECQGPSRWCLGLGEPSSPAVVRAERQSGARVVRASGVVVGSREGRAGGGNGQPPNFAVEPTSNSLRSCVAPAIRHGSLRALGFFSSRFFLFRVQSFL
jgi:hypothetical protein